MTADVRQDLALSDSNQSLELRRDSRDKTPLVPNNLLQAAVIVVRVETFNA
jgi:hypothetical protein